MLRLTMAAALAMSVFQGVAGRVEAEEAVDAQWIWFDAGDPAQEAPAAPVWFRNEFKAEEPSTGAALVACDDEFTLWVNGQKVGEGQGGQVYRFSLSGIVERGTNVFAVAAQNRSGRAGLFIDAEIRGQSGGRVPCDTSGEWLATAAAPAGDAWRRPRFDAAGWTAVKVIGPHAESPWKELSFAAGELDRFQVADGFALRKVAGPDLVGSLIAITWGNRGRLIASRERGPILNVIDADGDGNYDAVTEYSDQVKSCQGLCQVHDNLYAVGDGPQGPGLYRLPDADHDDRADEVVLITKCKGGMGEHGPHDVVLGPDGWLYHNLGNHAWIQNTPEPNSPCRNWEEGYLLEPAFEDAGGHAVGIQAPGGTVWRFTPDGKQWWAETVGFRNQYDIAFNQQGDLFTFDSDMEWDVNLPWYKPVRINHCIPGAEFGWRSGAKNWPEYYLDSLPAAVDIGRGSPTGVVFYEHTQFPEKYRGAMLNCDWSMGRIIVAYLKRDGATYTGTFDNLVTGNPLNVSDIEVDRDGSVVFSTGGRNTEGGLYRVTHLEGAKQTPRSPAAQTPADALRLPQPQAAWHRELAAGIKAQSGGEWERALGAAVQSGTTADKVRALTLLTQHGPRPAPELLQSAAADKDATVRQFATLLLGDQASPETAATLTRLLTDKNPVVQRRVCEAFVRTRLEPPVRPLLALLQSDDRWVRFAARLALERVDPDQVAKALAGRALPDELFLNWSLALHHGGASRAIAAAAVLETAQRIVQTQSRSRQRLDALRLLQLWSLRLGDRPPPGGASDARHGIGDVLLQAFQELPVSPGADRLVRAHLMETALLLAYYQGAGSAEALGRALAATDDIQLQTHLALCLRYVQTDWPADVKHTLLTWYETTRDWEGGNSLQGFLRNIVTGCLERYGPADRRAAILAWKQRPHAARLVLAASQPGDVQGFDDVIGVLLAELDQQPAAAGQELVALTVDVLGRSAAPESQALLRKLFDENADRRDLLARALARRPSAENVAYLLKGVASGDGTTVQLCLESLGKVDYKPARPEEFRAVILAGLKLGALGGKAAVNLLRQWTGVAPAGNDLAQQLAIYQQWFGERYPDEPPPELAQEDAARTKYTVSQLNEFLSSDPAAGQGDAARGRLVFAKANCLKCHRFMNEGEGVGPDLTTLRRRFQKKEIVEAVLLPSQVISDQFAAVTVQTVDGLVLTGMPLPNPGSKNLLLLLPDATRLEIEPEKIEDRAKAKVSVMPEGLFKDLTLADIADLFAFLETSRGNSEPASAGVGSGGK